MSSYSEYSLKTSTVKKVKVSPAPTAAAAAADATSDTSQSTAADAGRSVINAVRPILVLQALLGVGRLPVPGGTVAAALQKAYAVAVALGLLYVTLQCVPQSSTSPTPEAILNHHRISTWCNFLECIVYLGVATFAYRAEVTSMLSKLDRVDATLGIESDGRFMRAAELRSLFTATSILFFNAVTTYTLYQSAGSDIVPYAATIVCRVVHDCEVSYFIAAVNTINSRLRAFEWLVRPRLPTDAAVNEEKKQRWWNPPEHLVARPHPRTPLTSEQLWRVYSDIVDCGITFNETVSAQILASGVSSFCHILLSVHLNLILKQEVVGTSNTFSYDANPWNAAYLGTVTLRFFINHMRGCAAAEHSNTISRQINLHVHRALCDTALAGAERRSVESLALLTSRRPLRYTVYRIFCLDLSLPLSFFYLCVTYIIVLVQFAKL